MSPTELLAAARRLLDHTPSGTVSGWPRAAAVLARQAVEASIDGVWHAREPSIVGASHRAQLGCLRAWVADDLAAETSFVWHALTRATHHHPYELDPTREELASLLTTAERVCDELAVAAGTAVAA